MKSVTALPAIALLAFAAPAHAEDYTLTLKDHVFTPSTITLPADQQVKVTIINQDPTAEEFDSDDLSREKVIKGNSSGIVLLGPLKPGTYDFEGEYHDDTAKGQVIVK